jgi:hypothetical protein
VYTSWADCEEVGALSPREKKKCMVKLTHSINFPSANFLRTHIISLFNHGRNTKVRETEQDLFQDIYKLQENKINTNYRRTRYIQITGEQDIYKLQEKHEEKDRTERGRKKKKRKKKEKQKERGRES